MTSLTEVVAVCRGARLCVLTGAGISTESGIPDYRGPTAKPRNPIQHRAFVTDPAMRARYWARSALGWPRFKAFAPNAAHFALTELERAGRLGGLITQNVDRLHQKADTKDVVELHGALADVRCLSCGAHEARDALQVRLLEHNPAAARWAYELAPDGDAEIPSAALDGFVVPGCLICAGLLKPDVVFFGDNVPAARVDDCYRRVDEADVLLVVGSSLHVYSGFRFARHAHQQKRPVVILNQGPTRADELAQVKLEGLAGTLLPTLARALTLPS